ncbi:hypothetical protein T484DRAFT_1778635 [Baffinella frigidus]|nr:hypothetical protein T484DRAFT_1778635 [Cryptophyta sp. CCMP2293]
MALSNGATMALARGMTQRCTLLVLAAVGVTFLGSATGEAQCAPGFTLDGSSGGGCVACEAGTYKPLPGNGTCTPCPKNNTVSAEGSTSAASCECNAGFSDLMSLSCTGPCPCFDHSGPGQGTFRSNAAGSDYGFDVHCSWTISGKHPRVSFTSYKIEENDLVNVEGCYGRACSGDPPVTVPDHQSWSYDSPWVFESTTEYLRITFTSDGGHEIGRDRSGFEATWDAGTGATGVTDACLPCEVGTYKALPGNNQTCTTCPHHSFSAAGSTSAASCACDAGFTGGFTDDGASASASGGGCMACEAGTYKPLHSNGTCMLCPANTLSAKGGGGFITCERDKLRVACGASSCECAGGYTGEPNACVACKPGTDKRGPGSAPCQTVVYLASEPPDGSWGGYGWIVAVAVLLLVFAGTSDVLKPTP